MSGWHGSTISRWLRHDWGNAVIRNYSTSIFSYCGDGDIGAYIENGYASRGVVIVGSGLLYEEVEASDYRKNIQKFLVRLSKQLNSLDLMVCFLFFKKCKLYTKDFFRLFINLLKKKFSYDILKKNKEERKKKDEAKEENFINYDSWSNVYSSKTNSNKSGFTIKW